MAYQEVLITYIGGPTALIETAGFRLLTDPTFDPAGGVYGNLSKTMGPALEPDALGRVDAVLLSHDHHEDNLDHRGREFLKKAGRVLTTVEGAKRLGGNVVGLQPWESGEVEAGSALKITATPARHGPAHMDRGPVIGFVLSVPESERVVYVSGDTVWYEGVAEVAKKNKVGVAILFMGAARVARVGPWPLTMTAQDGVEAARAFPDAAILPLHYEGWKHFSESREEMSGGLPRQELNTAYTGYNPAKRCLYHCKYRHFRHLSKAKKCWLNSRLSLTNVKKGLLYLHHLRSDSGSNGRAAKEMSPLLGRPPILSF